MPSATSSARVISGGTKIATTASMPSSAAISSIVARKSSSPAPAIMSIGFAVPASAGSRAASVARVRGSSTGTRRPAASHASAQEIPGPPALVMIATRSPRGSGWPANSDATSNSSATVATRMTPACWNSASTVASEAASSAPVCDDAARAPTAERPLFTARIGLRAATRRAMRPNRRGLPNDSR